MPEMVRGGNSRNACASGMRKDQYSLAAYKRTGGRVVRCALVDAGGVREQELPAWMLDAAFCRTMRPVTDPVTDLRALAALRALLSETAAPLDSAQGAQGLTLASPEPNRGDRHGTPPQPDPDARSTARPLRSGPRLGGRRDAELGVASPANPMHADRAGDAPAGRPRRPRGTRSTERRR
jgi:hypothetical protein